MAKAKRTADYNGVFAVRLRGCMEKQGITQSELAKEIGKTRQAVNFYTLGETVPDADALILISRRLGVSADYLLGLSDVAALDTNIQDIHKLTGLSEKSIKGLIALRDNGLGHINTVFNSMLENNIFFTEAWKIAEYIKYRALSMAYLKKAIEPYSTVEESAGDISKLSNDDMFDVAISDFKQYKDYDAKATAAIFNAQNLIFTKGVAYLPDEATPQKEYEYTNTNVYKALSSAYQRIIDETLTATENN